MLYDALHAWLVGAGKPLPSLYWQRLPEYDDGNEVMVAAVTTAGIGATKYLGSEAVNDPGRPWLEHDGGVLWFHTGLTFEARAKDTKQRGAVQATDVLNNVRDRMLILADEARILPANTAVAPYDEWMDLFGRNAEQERIVWAEVTNPPFLLEQDRKERPIIQLLMECRHAPVRS